MYKPTTRELRNGYEATEYELCAACGERTGRTRNRQFERSPKSRPVSLRVDVQFLMDLAVFCKMHQRP